MKKFINLLFPNHLGLSIEDYTWEYRHEIKWIRNHLLTPDEIGLLLNDPFQFCSFPRTHFYLKNKE
jgi:hypothetical protein